MKMKKLVAVLAVVGMTGVMMAGCGSSSAAANTDSDAASQDQASDWDSSMIFQSYQEKMVPVQEEHLSNYLELKKNKVIRKLI